MTNEGDPKRKTSRIKIKQEIEYKARTKKKKLCYLLNRLDQSLNKFF